MRREGGGIRPVRQQARHPVRRRAPVAGTAHRQQPHAGADVQAIRDVAKVQAGQRVLVIGAGGGVGTLTVQIAKAFGAEVTGACSSSKADLVRSVGADEVIDYTQEDITDGTQHWDVIVDTALPPSAVAVATRAHDEGNLAIVGGDRGGTGTGDFFRQMLRAPLWSLVIGQRLRPVVSKEDGDDLQALAELVGTGAVTPVVGSTYPLVEASDAIRELERGHARGKIIVTVQSSQPSPPHVDASRVTRKRGTGPGRP